MDALQALGRSLDLGAAAQPILEELAATMSPRSWKAGDTVINEGDPPGQVYLVETGRVRLTSTRSDGREELLADIGPGELIGEMTSLLERPRTATATVVADVTGWELPATALLRAYQRDGALALRTMLSMMALVVERDARAARRAGRTPLQEVANRVLELQRRFGAAEGDVIPISQSDLAFIVGLSAGSFSVMFGKLVRSGAVASAPGGVVVTSAEMLRRLAND